MKQVREYYEREARILKNHQKLMYFGSPWNRYWHGTRLCQILKIVKNIRFKNFLDAGCAEGYYVKLLTNCSDFPSFYGVGLDIAKDYILKAKKKAPHSLLLLGDAQRLPFKDSCFDLVLCSEVLEHIWNPEMSFKELVRVSKNYILVTVTGENLFYHFAKKLGLMKPKDPFAEIGHGHIHELRMSETIVPWALRAGCKCVYKIVTCYFPISFLQKHRIPAFYISIIKFADKLVSKLPVVREFGAVQIALLQR